MILTDMYVYVCVYIYIYSLNSICSLIILYILFLYI